MHRLSFSQLRLDCRHAFIRIPLPQMRAGQRDSGPLQRLDRCQVPALRLGETGEEVLHIRLEVRRRGECAEGWWRRRWLRLRLRVPCRTAPALKQFWVVAPAVNSGRHNSQLEANLNSGATLAFHHHAQRLLLIYIRWSIAVFLPSNHTYENSDTMVFCFGRGYVEHWLLGWAHRADGLPEHKLGI